MAKDKSKKKDKKGKGGAPKDEEFGFMLEGVVLSYPHLYHKTSSVAGSKARFKTACIIDPDTKAGAKALKTAQAVQKKVEVDKFGKPPKKYKENRCCLEFEPEDQHGNVPDEVKGKWVLRLATDDRPTVVDRRRNPVAEDDGLMYGGAIVNIFGRMYGMDDPDKGGVGLFGALEGVQYVAEGERFGHAPLANDAFPDLGDPDEDEDEKPKKKDKGKDKTKDKAGKKKKKDKNIGI